jgi:hypothetical protein
MGLTLVAHHVRNLRGGSQSVLVQASDGFHYVAKFSNNLQGPNLPFNESMGSELFKSCGLTGPKWRPLLVTDRFIDQNPDCWPQTPAGRLRPSAGLCFGSRFLGGAGIRLLEILPGSSFRRVHNRTNFWLAWLVDICAVHTDNRQAVFVERQDRRLEAHFVDHSHLFGGPNGNEERHFKVSKYLDSRVYENVSSDYLAGFQATLLNLDTDRLWRRIGTLSDDWKTPSALTAFAHCLERLSTARVLEDVFVAMVSSHQGSGHIERSDSQSGEETGGPLLHAEIFGAKWPAWTEGSARARESERPAAPVCTPRVAHDYPIRRPSLL